MSADALHIDLETRSTVDLRRVGAHRYAEDPTTEIVLGAYRFGKGPISVFYGSDLPFDVRYHVAAGGTMVGHNQMFERVMLAAKADLRVPVWQQDCTMARACAVGLPASLEGTGAATRATVKKDVEGRRLMLQMCRPRTREPLTWWTDAERMARLARYCENDVAAESDIAGRLPALSTYEQRIWRLDQTINDRGFAVDTESCRRASGAVAEALRRADRRIAALTNGQADKVTQAARIVAWIEAQGVPCESIAEGEFEGLLIGAELFDKPVIAEVVRIRQSSAKALKYQAILDCVCRDGRVRGSLAYHAAHTGRWAGRNVQPHNMKRIESEKDAAMVRTTLQILFKHDNAVKIVDALELLFGDVLEALSLCSRAMIVAGLGKKLYGGDYSNIEGRLNAWFAGEAWKLQAFRDYDAGIGPDLYRVMAARILGISVDDVAREQRQIWGKVPELACGYQGAFNAFSRYGAKVGLRLPKETIHRVVQGWRAENPHIVESWYELQDAAMNAVSAKGCIVSALNGKIQYVSTDHGFLFCRLPSGRVISYAQPAIEWKKKIITIDDETIEIEGHGLTYWGEKKGWRKLDLYGGAQCAHVVSGAARDLLADAMLDLEAADYSIVLTVHDEIIAETDPAFGSVDDFRARMAAARRWAEGLPVSVAAWEGDRYED
jgi:DNA polymerase